MPDKHNKREVARNVRDQLDSRVFRRAMRSGHKPPTDDEQFTEILERLEKKEDRQK